MTSWRFVLLASAYACVFVFAAAAQTPPAPHFQANTAWRIVGHTGFAFSDLNGDGLVDAAGKDPNNPSSLHIKVWYNGKGTGGQLFGGCNAFGQAATDYGMSIGDFENRGFPGIASEPRGTSAFVLLRNLGSEDCGSSDPFEQHACVFAHCGDDPDSHCPSGDDTESAVWFDANNDGWLDLFIPAYNDPNVGGSLGNSYFENRPNLTGCTGYPRRLEEPADIYDLANQDPNVPGENPEGSQACDYDGDADLDLFFFNWRHGDGASGCVHQNRTGDEGDPPPTVFAFLSHTSAGFSPFADEGMMLSDVDMDGDFDLIVYEFFRDATVYVYPNLGDGTFDGENKTVAAGSPTYGISMTDADLDGDYDLMRSERLTLNRYFDSSGSLPGVVPEWTTNIDFDDTVNIVPHLTAWADIDRDGDQDVAVSRYTTNSGSLPNVFENLKIKTDPNNPNDPNLHTPENARRFVKVRPVKAVDPNDPNGPYTENEFGAVAEIVIDGDTLGLRRRQFTASSSGYLNQNEYMLTFGLPPDPTPSDAETDLTFSVCVDFPAHPNAGLVRIDRTINEHLGSIQLKDLYGTYREITVWRDGRVKIGENVYDPAEGEYPSLSTAGGPLVLPDGENAMPALIDADDPNDDEDHSFVALRFTHVHDTGNVRIREIILDGVLAAPDGNCDNIVLVRMPEPMSFSPTPTAV